MFDRPQPTLQNHWRLRQWRSELLIVAERLIGGKRPYLEADDVVQDVMLHLCQNQLSAQTGAMDLSFDYVVTAIRNQIITKEIYFTRERRNKHREQPLTVQHQIEDALVYFCSPDEGILSQEAWQECLAVADNPLDREILIGLKEGLNQKSLAQRLSVTPATICRRTKKLKRMLTSLIRQLFRENASTELSSWMAQADFRKKELSVQLAASESVSY